MTAEEKLDKQQRREAQRLWDDARAAFDAGDYAEVRRLDAKVVALAGGHDLGDKATHDLARFRLDGWGLRVGLATVALYILAWVYALS